MHTRLMDIVVLVAEMTRSGEGGSDDLGRELSGRGFTSEEVDTALSWYAQNGNPQVGAAVRTRTRVLSEFERMSISSECYGYVLRLLNLGIVSMEQFDRIIGRAIPVGPEKVHLGDVKDIASSVLFDSDAADLGGEDFAEPFAGDSPTV